MKYVAALLRRIKGMNEKAKRFLTDYRTLLGLWLLIGVCAAIFKMHNHNNFLIFRGVFWHTIDQLPLFIHYPAEYGDMNHYGPLFSLVIAPFAVVPEWLGLIMWDVALALFLYVAIRNLAPQPSTLNPQPSSLAPRTSYLEIFTLWFCAHELLTGLFMQQFNVAIAAIIILSFILIERERDFTAAFFIILGTFVKLYGIVGLAFFFFSRHKGRFVLALLFWSVVMFVAPMLISSPEYIIGQYADWYDSLSSKNAENMSAVGEEIHRIGTNISLLGMVRRISGLTTYSDLWLIGGGLVLFLLPYLRISQYRNIAFRQTLMASVLMFTVLFSTGSESSSYIIAFCGVCIWYACVPWKRNNWDIALLVFVFVLSSLSPSDLFPAYLRKEWVQPYALKALPVTIVWFKLCWEMMRRDYSTSLT